MLDKNYGRPKFGVSPADSGQPKRSDNLMWLVSTLLFDQWFESFNEAYACWEKSPKTRTFPRLDSGWPTKPEPFAAVIR